MNSLTGGHDLDEMQGILGDLDMAQDSVEVLVPVLANRLDKPDIAMLETEGADKTQGDVASTADGVDTQE
jgi:hypothetical protein